MSRVLLHGDKEIWIERNISIQDSFFVISPEAHIMVCVPGYHLARRGLGDAMPRIEGTRPANKPSSSDIVVVADRDLRSDVTVLARCCAYVRLTAFCWLTPEVT